jgi:hypothetical protein
MKITITPRIKPMRFESRDVVALGDKVLWRCAPGWGKKWDEYYSITGSDWHRIGGFYTVPKGRKLGDWGVRPRKKKGQRMSI